jgi:4-methyl-5(b-hydroxyethyl)-thiazole monophosphate biosynthesis
MKGMIVFADHFEDVEGLATLAILRRCKIEVDAISVMGRKDIITQYNQKVSTDELIENIQPEDYGFLIIPGGRAVRSTLSSREDIARIIQRFNDQGKMIAAICAAPSLLGALGVLDGKNFTCFPGVEAEILKGIHRAEKKALTDGNIITARSAGSVYEFSYEIIRYLRGVDEADWMLKNIVF